MLSYPLLFLMGYPFIVMSNTRKLIPNKNDMEHLLNCCWVTTLFGSTSSGICLLITLSSIITKTEAPNFYELFCEEFFPDSKPTIINDGEFSDGNFVPIE